MTRTHPTPAPVAFDFPYQRTLNAISDAISFPWADDSGKPHTFGISVERFQRSFNESTVGGEIRPTPVAHTDRVREVLEFYGNEARWDAYDEDQRAAQFDRNTGADFNERGQKARDLLAALKSTAAPKDGEAAGHG